MKLLVVLLSTLVAFSASADDKTKDARQDFARLSALEAYSSNQFSKQVGNINVAGNYINGTDLCVAGDMITTKVPSFKSSCVEWTYRNSKGDRKYTTSIRLASKNDARCSKKERGAKIASPISFNKEVTIWGARKSGEMITNIGTNTPETFSSFARAQEEGTPVALGTKVVNVKVPTTYKVNFYRYTASDKFNRNKFVGSHTFGVGACH